MSRRLCSRLIPFAQRQWFLCLLVLLLTFTWCVPAAAQPLLDPIEPRVVVFISLFFMTLGLPARRLIQSVIRPWPALWATLLSYSLLPALGWGAGALVPYADLRVGLLVIASVPCTLSSAILWSRMGQGDEGAALLTVLLTTLFGWIGTTTWLAIGTGNAVVVDPIQLMQTLAWSLVCPVFVGQAARMIRPLADWMDRRRKWIGVVVQFLVLLVLCKAMLSLGRHVHGREVMASIPTIVWTVALCAAVHATGLCIGSRSAALLGMDRAAQFAVGIACSQKTLPVALMLYEAYFEDDYPLAVLPMLFYHVGQLFVDTLAAQRWSRETTARLAKQDLAEGQFERIRLQ